MNLIKIVLVLIAVAVFLLVVYKLVYERGPLTTRIPTKDEVQKNVQGTLTTCDVSKLGQLVTYDGNPLQGSNLRCEECTSYLSLTDTGSCKYLDRTCKTYGETVPCPFS